MLRLDAPDLVAAKRPSPRRNVANYGVLRSKAQARVCRRGCQHHPGCIYEGWPGRPELLIMDYPSPRMQRRRPLGGAIRAAMQRANRAVSSGSNRYESVKQRMLFLRCDVFPFATYRASASRIAVSASCGRPRVPRTSPSATQAAA